MNKFGYANSMVCPTPKSYVMGATYEVNATLSHVLFCKFCLPHVMHYVYTGDPECIKLEGDCEIGLIY